MSTTTMLLGWPALFARRFLLDIFLNTRIVDLMKRLTADDVIQYADEALEGENRHSESASRIWDQVRPFIKPGKQLAAAKALAEGLEVGTDWEELTNEAED